ncbi:sugar-phosphatase [Sanguibacter gelidistatuariae]|uniref:Sugar-phosphatase n=1 Tax=Sanguibacter gelidistatuariae TaxID=1814289 RepID=A0A1G6HNV3_9MICO|nr:HAD-IA family hydrolase [Sanguibacter gelidistatuariae]SDB95932.1 sugar-phosphatase [Sanguibacter gelidistatuariae]
MLTPGLAFADRTFDAILFDMDGTLISSIAAVDRSWARWAGEYGYDSETFQISHGTPARTLVEQLVPPEQVEEAVARINAIELADTDGVLLLPGTGSLFEALPADRHAIITSCTRDLALARIAAAGITAPGVVVTADDVAHGKPDPEPFVLGAALLGFAPSRCLVVEDAPAGLASGRAAGCATLAVNGTHDLTELDADAHAPGLARVGVVVAADGTLRIVDL